MGSFNPKDYQRRLRLLREVLCGGQHSQRDFADMLGIPMKRWNNYERGYPVPRETAFLLMERFPGVSVEWLWFGMTGNLSKSFHDMVMQVEQAERDLEIAEAAMRKARQRISQVREARSKRSHPRD